MYGSTILSGGKDVPDNLSVTLSMFSWSEKTKLDSRLDGVTVFKKSPTM